MKRLLLFILACITLYGCKANVIVSSKDTITQNALSQWQDMKYGLFIHYGLYSVAGGVWNGKPVPYYAEQIMNHARIPIAEYEKLCNDFTANGWYADSVVLMAKSAGMRYIVITSKHHDGFNMYHSKVSPYNVVDATPAKRDIIGELADACKRHSMPLGFYYSLPDWHYDKGLRRIEIDTTTDCTQFVNQVYSPLEHITPDLEQYIVTQLKELLTQYGDIITIWFDMGLLTPQQSERFRETVKSIQPNCLVSGRIMNNYGDYLTLPDNGNVSGFTDLAWDNPASLYGTWGYRSWCERPALEIQIEHQLNRLLKTVSHGGVFLLNIGPKGDGSVLDYEKKVLEGVGKWMKTNSESIYSTRPAKISVKESGVYVTQKDSTLYIISRNPEISSITLLNTSIDIESVYRLSDGSNVDHTTSKGNIVIAQSTEQFSDDNCVTVLKFRGDIEVGMPEVVIDGDRFILTEDNGVIHSAFDAHGYMTTQSKSYISWRLRSPIEGKYSVFVEYQPMVAANEYRFTFGKKSIVHVLPGVDKMLQTASIGDIELQNGDTDIEINLADRKNILDGLGLTRLRIILRKK